MLQAIYKTPQERQGFRRRLQGWMKDEKIADGITGDVNGIYYWQGQFAHRAGPFLKDLGGTALTPKAVEALESAIFTELSREKGVIASTKRAGERGTAEPRRYGNQKVVSMSGLPIERGASGRHDFAEGVGFDGNR